MRLIISLFLVVNNCVALEELSSRLIYLFAISETALCFAVESSAGRFVHWSTVVISRVGELDLRPQSVSPQSVTLNSPIAYAVRAANKKHWTGGPYSQKRNDGTSNQAKILLPKNHHLKQPAHRACK